MFSNYRCPSLCSESGDSEISRRGFILAAAAAGFVGIPSEALAAPAIKVWGLWLKTPKPLSPDLNKVRGTLAFRVGSDKSDRLLTIYGAGKDWRNTPRQCVELIKRYASLAGVKGFEAKPGKGDLWTAGPAVGNAHEVAARLRTLSAGGFEFQSNGSTTLPKAGAVISFAPWTDNEYGHVGILCNHDPNDAKTGTVRIKMVDQNVQRANWTEVRFRKSGGRWYGEMPNAAGDAYYPASGWASPAG